MMRPPLHITVPTNRTYRSERNCGRPAPMDGLNELIRQSRTNRYHAADAERENVQWVAQFVRRAMRKAHYPPMTVQDRQRCNVYVCIVEPHDQRDVANVYGGVLKYALDALTHRNEHGVGAIWDDNTKWMPKLVPSIRIDPANVGIEITIVPLED